MLIDFFVYTGHTLLCSNVSLGLYEKHTFTNQKFCVAVTRGLHTLVNKTGLLTCLKTVSNNLPKDVAFVARLESGFTGHLDQFVSVHLIGAYF